MNLLDNLNPIRERELMMTRRQLFGRTALGLGTAAMADMMTPSLLGQNGLGGGAEGTHHKAKAKRVDLSTASDRRAFTMHLVRNRLVYLMVI